MTQSNGIEYAVTQDLRELKDVGSHDSKFTSLPRPTNVVKIPIDTVSGKGHPLLPTDWASTKGDLNTGRVATLVDFVDWSVAIFLQTNMSWFSGVMGADMMIRMFTVLPAETYRHALQPASPRIE